MRCYVIEGGGHTWPDAEDYAGGAGPTTHEINASDLIWEFLNRDPLLPLWVELMAQLGGGPVGSEPTLTVAPFVGASY